MRKARPTEMVIGGVAALALVCAAIIARTGRFGIETAAGLSQTGSSAAGAHHP